MNFIVTANVAGGGMEHAGMSGGDRIALALMRQWAKEGHSVTLFTSKSGEENFFKDIKREYPGAVTVHNTSEKSMKRFSRWGLIRFEWEAHKKGRKALLEQGPAVHPEDIVYSSSDLWPDAGPAYSFKKRHPDITWIAGFYMFAPAPWSLQSPYKGLRWPVGLLYWLIQKIFYGLISRNADMVFVTSEPDAPRFVTRRRAKDKVVVVRGGVDLKPSQEYLASSFVIPPEKRKYDACFIGRFHYQKGVLELVDIWKKVCETKRDARLVMIGNGPLEKQVQNAVKKRGLEQNIELEGFLDGEKKYEFFKNSRIVVHPATYDSGGMAAAEAMAWGLPGVSFDLEALKSYYPKGMIKAPKGDMDLFAEKILTLLTDKAFYTMMAGQARDLVVQEWDWDKRAKDIYDQCQRLT